ncbi:MAG: response regulator [Flavitalea sp.]
MLHHRPIIIIDDDQDDRDMLGTIVNDLQITNEVIFLHDGKSAFEYLKTMESPAALIICDINMPKMNGFQLKREINKDPGLNVKCVPFFFLTTTVSKQAAEEAYSLGVQGFYVKESSFDGMTDVVKYMLEFSKHGIFPKDLEDGRLNN